MTREELLQIAKPVLFNTEMTVAILDGRKTVTRRCVKPKSKNACGFYVTFRKSDNAFMGVYDYDENERQFDNSQTPPACIGDILYIRETWSEWTGGYVYKAWSGPFPQPGKASVMKWHPSIHMPKEAARIFLRVTDVRAERLQDITEEQAMAEGAKQCYEQIDPLKNRPVTYLAEDGKGYYVLGFKKVWNGTIKKTEMDIYGWDANPWVWVIEFERIEAEQ